MQGQLLTTKEAAELLGYTVAHVYRLAYKGILTPQKTDTTIVGHRALCRIPLEQVEHIICQRGNKKQYYPDLPSNPRAEKAIAIRQANPCATLQQIGDKLNITREGVRQLLKARGIETKSYRQRQLYECLNCGAPTRNRMFCDRECRKQYGQIPIECEVCHKIFYRWRSQIIPYGIKKREHMFCSKKCQGVWLGKSHGGSSSNSSGIKTRRYDYDAIMEQVSLQRQNGITYGKIVQNLSVPLSTLYYIRCTFRKRRTEGHHDIYELSS